MKNKNFEKTLNCRRCHHQEISTCVSKTTIMTYGSWDMQWDCLAELIAILGYFFLFNLLATQKHKILKNGKSIWRCRQFIHACTCNFHNLYVSWDMECGRYIFLSFSAIFCPFTQLTTRKIKIFKTWKKHLEISSFYSCVLQMTVIWYMTPEI